MAEGRSLQIKRLQRKAIAREREFRIAWNHAVDIVGSGMKVIVPGLPREFRDMVCGAATRTGGTCKITNIAVNGRCRFHGGKSIGPLTPEGRARALANLKRRWAHRIGTP